MSALDLPFREQAAGIASGDIDAGELLEECLGRIVERNPDLNAIVATFPDESRRMLAEAPPGPLHGVPVAIKDEWPLPWRAERFGAYEGYLDSSPRESGPYRVLRDAGAVIVGVANMHELGSGSTGALSAYGPARNPWDLSRCPGGSSSGPASAVGGGLVAGAVAADGIGSIRYPAAYCGLTGLKPTFGRSEMEGHHIAHTTTIVSGPICADAADCRLLASVLFGEELTASEPSGLRIGTVSDPLWVDCQPGVRERAEEALAALVEETGSGVEEVEIDGLSLVPLASILIGSTEEIADMTPAFLNSLSEEMSPINRALLKYRTLLPGALFGKAERVRVLARRAFAAVFQRVDLLAWPTVPAVAPPLDNPTAELPSGVHAVDGPNVRHCGFGNLTGLPAISLPAGLSDGMPVGLQLIGPWGSDELLLDAAEAIERATDRRWVEAIPPLAEVGTADT